MSEQLSTALVTGGSRGIGKAIAETLAKAGYQVYLTYVSKADEAEAVAKSYPDFFEVLQALGIRAEIRP